MQVQLVATPSDRFAAHSHDEYVISLNSASVVREQVRLDRTRFDVGPSQVTVYNPGEVQSSIIRTAGGRPWSCLSLYVTVEQMRRLTGREVTEFARPVVTDRRIAAALRRAVATDDPHLATEWTSWAAAACVDVAGHRLQPVDPSTPDLVHRAMTRLREDLSIHVRVGDLAMDLGADANALARGFVKATGVPPYAWHLHLRLLEAQRRLRRGDRPSVVAHALGFSDQSHLHRHFRAAYGRTPGDEWQDSAADRSRPSGSFKTPPARRQMLGSPDRPPGPVARSRTTHDQTVGMGDDRRRTWT